MIGRNVIYTLAACAVLAPIALALVLVWFHKFFIYQFDQTIIEPAALDIAGLRIEPFAAADGRIVRAWIVPPIGKAPVIVYLPGNASSAASSLLRMHAFIQKGYGVAVLEYRGSGGVGGTPSEANFRTDSRFLYDNLDQLFGQELPYDRRFLHGFSLGAALAIPLAAERAFGAVVFESPLSSATDYYTHRFHGLPMRWLMWSERYDYADRVAELNAPLLFLRGKFDRVIPESSFMKLVTLAPETSTIKVYPDGGHSDLLRRGATEDILLFYARNLESEAWSAN